MQIEVFVFGYTVWDALHIGKNTNVELWIKIGTRNSCLGFAYRIIIKAMILTNACIMLICAGPTFASNS